MGEALAQLAARAGHKCLTLEELRAAQRHPVGHECVACDVLRELGPSLRGNALASLMARSRLSAVALTAVSAFVPTTPEEKRAARREAKRRDQEARAARAHRSDRVGRMADLIAGKSRPARPHRAA